MAKPVNNPLPLAKSDEELANSFAMYFENKILTIRKQFQGIPQYHSEPSEASKLQKSSAIMEDQVALIVKNMNTMLCELDAIPTHITDAATGTTSYY